MQSVSCQYHSDERFHSITFITHFCSSAGPLLESAYVRQVTVEKSGILFVADIVVVHRVREKRGHSILGITLPNLVTVL